MVVEAVTEKRGLIPTLPAAVAFVPAVKSHRASVVGKTAEPGEGVALELNVFEGVALAVGEAVIVVDGLTHTPYIDGGNTRMRPYILSAMYNRPVVSIARP